LVWNEGCRITIYVRRDESAIGRRVVRRHILKEQAFITFRQHQNVTPITERAAFPFLIKADEHEQMVLHNGEASRRAVLVAAVHWFLNDHSVCIRLWREITPGVKEAVIMK